MANKAAALAALEWFEGKARESLTKATRARVYAEMHREDAERHLADAEAFALAFGVKWKRPALEELQERARKAAKAAEAAARKAEKARKERARLRLLQARDDLEAWQRGIVHYVPTDVQRDADGSAFLRRHISARGDLLETSQGAEVPWQHAVRVFRFVKLCKERGEGWTRNGRTIRVGHFQVDAITREGNMRAGCHQIAWRHIEALARAQGVFDEEPSAEVVETREHA